MENRLSDRLDKIKREKREIRWEKLKEICRDSDKINDALDIVKFESSAYPSGIALFTAVVALILSLYNFYNNSLPKSFPNISPLPIIFIVALIFVIYYIYDLRLWIEVYYDLIELRMMKRDETKPTVLSKLDEIIYKVKEIIPRIDFLEKNVNSKMEAIEKEIVSIKKK